MPRRRQRSDVGRDLVADGDRGKREPHGRPSGADELGPVVPWQPPSTLVATTNHRSVSIGAPGPDRAVPPARRRVPRPGRPGDVAVAGQRVQHQHDVVAVG